MQFSAVDKLRIYFTKWQILHSETALDRLQCERADNHHALKIRHAGIQVWKAFTKESIRKKVGLLEKTCFCICQKKDADQLHGDCAAD